MGQDDAASPSPPGGEGGPKGRMRGWGRRDISILYAFDYPLIRLPAPSPPGGEGESWQRFHSLCDCPPVRDVPAATSASIWACKVTVPRIGLSGRAGPSTVAAVMRA